MEAFTSLEATPCCTPQGQGSPWSMCRTPNRRLFLSLAREVRSQSWLSILTGRDLIHLASGHWTFLKLSQLLSIKSLILNSMSMGLLFRNLVAFTEYGDRPLLVVYDLGMVKKKVIYLWCVSISWFVLKSSFCLISCSKNLYFILMFSDLIHFYTAAFFQCKNL